MNKTKFRISLSVYQKFKAAVFQTKTRFIKPYFSWATLKINFFSGFTVYFKNFTLKHNSAN